MIKTSVNKRISFQENRSKIKTDNESQCGRDISDISIGGAVFS